jgi:hypothetical protein
MKNRITCVGLFLIAFLTTMFTLALYRQASHPSLVVRIQDGRPLLQDRPMTLKQLEQASNADISQESVEMWRKYQQGLDAQLEFQNLLNWTNEHSEYTDQMLPRLRELIHQMDTIREDMKVISARAEKKVYGTSK